MLQLTEVALSRGGKSLLQGASMTVHPGWKVGLVGANGTGKSSLFGLLRGEWGADQGTVSVPATWRMAHVAQDTPASSQSARDYALDGDVLWRQLDNALLDAEARHDGIAIAHLHQELDLIDGYRAVSRAESLLMGLGFTLAQLDQPVATFSGGWRMRLNLARALLARADLLLLDEPTNHLDLDTVLWLEDWLRRDRNTLLLVSHDRAFLDGVVDHIVHLERGQLTTYFGGYSDFEQQRAARLAQDQAANAKAQREAAHLQAFVDRFRAKASKAKQAQSRLKALNRLSVAAVVHGEAAFEVSFRPPKQLPNPLIQLNKIDIGYGETPLLRQVNLSIEPGTRLGLLGANGAGKSTLIKHLSGELPALSGQRQLGQGLVMGYFAQHQLDYLRLDRSALQHLQALDPTATDQQLRDFIGGFGFRGELALCPVAPFSGGEKARLALALLVWQRPNVLLLDEPTNHLDLAMRHALTVGLQQYSGALVVVSHDRHLLESCTDRFVVVANGRVTAFDGDLQDYHQQQRSRPAAAVVGDTVKAKTRAGTEKKSSAAKAAPQTPAPIVAKPALPTAAQTAQRKPLERQLAKLEASLAAAQHALDQVDRALASPTLYSTGDGKASATLAGLLADQAQHQAQVAALESEWLALQTRLDALS